MKGASRRTGAVLVVAALFVVAFHLLPSSSDLLAQSAPLPDHEAFFAAARENMSRSQREQQFYAYKERRTELHTNPFGKIGTSGTNTYDVQPGPQPGTWQRRLLEKDGKPVADAPIEKQEPRTGRRSGGQGRSRLDDVVATLEFQMRRRETIDGRAAIVVEFSPRPQARPQTREGRMAKIFKGTIWVDEAAREVIRVEATAIDDLSYGLGLVAKLNEGTTVKLTREPVDSIWMPTSIRFAGQGRAMIFRKLNVDYQIDWFDYRRVGS
jgi:hypothetical protein